MKKIIKSVLCAAAALTCFAVLPSCSESVGKSTKLGTPANAAPLEYIERLEESCQKIYAASESFAAKFAAEAYADADKNTNFVVSPVSVYSALALAAECASGNTRSELLSALNISYDELRAGFPAFYRGLNEERKDPEGELISKLNMTNSIWIDDSAGYNQSCIDDLANKYYCYSYSADFKNDNSQANKAIRHFVKEQTNDLIDQDFELSEDTLFTLINTLYLKDVWNQYGDDLPFTPKKYDFKCADGKIKSQKLLQGYYNGGRVHEEESFATFMTTTSGGYTIKFIKPKDGYSLSQVFTGQNIALVNSISDYRSVDEPNRIRYFTRCLFPEFESSSDIELSKLLKNKFNIATFFDENLCEFETLSPLPQRVYCSSVKHVAKLKADKKGIEGAAVTVVAMDSAAAPEPIYEDVYADFVLDRAFGFILTDRYGTTLFSGTVADI